MLSETYKSTSGRVLADQFNEEVAEVLRSFNGPIYHVNVITYTDMDYSPHYRSRTVYVDIYDVSVWSYTDRPVLYKYLIPGSYWGECDGIIKNQHPNPKEVDTTLYNRIAKLNA